MYSGAEERNSVLMYRFRQKRSFAWFLCDFSERYLKSHPEPFYPKTYMYYEMEILEWMCRREGSVVRYDPSICALHYQHEASRQELKSIIRRSKFVMDCLLDSLTAAEELILETGGEERV